MNQLKNEKSLYLLQHKDNPVHWFSFGPEALKKSKEENKPIFLSIGYSSCHWCHVMASESFEDQETADYLNKNFINIKVDREELPDLDAYYQQACQLFIQSGGWPLSAFLLPDMRPFFVGTYFPKEPREEATSFKQLLEELSRAYNDNFDQVSKNASQVTESLSKPMSFEEKIEFNNHFPHPMAILDAIQPHVDIENGGYGKAPKFPQYSFYEWAVEQVLEGMIDKEKGQHIVNSVESMISGGLYDHAKGGVHRYSTDEKWLVPHFEKMLYDQAGMLRLLSKLSLLYPSPLIYDAIVDTLEYLASEMKSSTGHFFSAQNADSEGVEGLYFTFTMEEFETMVNRANTDENKLEENIDKLKKWFQIKPEGNFEHQLNVISLNPKHKEEYYQKENWDLVRIMRAAMLEERKMRVPPSTDSKGVASWNFMLLSSLLDVVQYCRIPFIKKKAFELFDQSLEETFKTFVKLLDPGAKNAFQIQHSTSRESDVFYSEDYVTFAESQLRAYELTGNKTFLQNTKDTINFVIDKFLKDNQLMTRLVESEAIYPNQDMASFDGSFKSISATFVNLVRRANVLFKDPNWKKQTMKLHELLKDHVLRNPISGGEGLRASTYPDTAYRLVEVPIEWLNDEKYIEFMNFFLPRFVLKYHDKKNNEWQITQQDVDTAELQGDGLESFMKTLRPSKENG